MSPSGPAPLTNTELAPPRELNAALPGEINDLIVSLLCKEPAGRPRSVREVAERLAGWALAILPLPPGEGRGEGGLKPGAESRADAGAPSSAARPHPNPLPEGEGTNAAPPATLPLLRHLECDRMGGGRCEILALRWSADGCTLQVFDRTAAYVFDATSGELLAKAPRLDRDQSYLLRANFSPDGRFLAVATTRTRVWDMGELNEAASATNALRDATPKAGRNDKETRRQGEKGKRGQGDKGTRGQGDKESTDALPNLISEIQTPKLRLVASVVPLGDKQWAVVSAEGHWLGTPEAEQRLVYVIQTAAGQETLTPAEFYQRFNWKNDPSKVVLPE